MVEAMKGRKTKKDRRKDVEAARALHQALCEEMLLRWAPLVTSQDWMVEKEQRGKTVLEEEPLEMGLKVGAFVLKVMERWARLDGLDAAEKRDVSVSEVADPAEVARRIEAVRPQLVQQLETLRQSGQLGEPEERSGMAIASLMRGD